MKKIVPIKKVLYALVLMLLTSSSALSQVIVNEGFENSCSNHYNAFHLGCIPGWIATSGTPDTQALNTGLSPAHQGSRFVQMYAKLKNNCLNPELSEGIVYNHVFQAGVTYKISYWAKGPTTSNPASTIYNGNWILTNGLQNQTGGNCQPGEYTPTIPAGSQILPNTVSNMQGWTLNQFTFIPTSNFTQIWFRNTFIPRPPYRITDGIWDFYTSIGIDDVLIEKLCTPTITGASSFCLGSPISFTGSVAGGCEITNNVWTVVECDANGIVVPGASEWWSPWAPGTPGTLTVPTAASGGPTMTCGKYYQIKLAVQTLSTSWIQTTKVIYINCPPVIRFDRNMTNQICTGERASLIVSAAGATPSSHTMTWTPISPAGPSVYSGPLANINVYPTQTTTYECTITDNATGCSSSAQWTVNVINNDPKFSLSITTASATDFNIALTANDPLGYNNPGFYYTLIIEELDGSLNPYYQDFGTSCWWNYPNQETFQGYVSTGIGTFTQTPGGACTVPAGSFLYNQTYRITRGVWNDTCPYTQFSVIISAAGKLGRDPEVEVKEDTNAPDYSMIAMEHAKNQIELENEATIYPNPGTGVYTLKLVGKDNASIEIYNKQGEKITTVQQTGEETKIDLTGLPKGIYFAHIILNEQRINKTIILE